MFVRQTLHPIATMQAADGEPWSIRGGPLNTFDARFDPPCHAIPSRAGFDPSSRRRLAVVDIFGVLAYHSLLADTSIEMLQSVLDSLSDHRSIDTIVLHTDSIGGPFAGSVELADSVRRAAQKKQVIAHINSTVAGTSYAAISGASRIVITPSGQVGGLGVAALHVDRSGQLEKAGLRTTLIRAGRHKYEGHPFGALSDDTVRHIQQTVNDAYSIQIGDIAKGRKTDRFTVMTKFGDGRMLSPHQALAAGMVDRIQPFDSLMQELLPGSSGQHRSRFGSGVRSSAAIAKSHQSHIVCGYAVTFDSTVFRTDSHSGRPIRARIMPGAFRQILRRRDDVCLCYRHRTVRPLASVSDGRLRLQETPYGLWFEASLPATSRGSLMARAVADGIASGASIGWLPGSSRTVRERGRSITEHTEIRQLNDIAITHSPLDPATKIAIVEAGLSAQQRQRQLMLLRFRMRN